MSKTLLEIFHPGTEPRIMPSAKTNAATRNRRKAYVLDKIVEFVDDDRAYVDEINIGDGRKVRLCRNEVTNAVEILVMEGATP